MDKKVLENRTKKFAVNVIGFVTGLPKDRTSDVIGRQLLRSGTSIGANYREANRAQSYRDFIYKIAIVEKEASETQYWLDLLNDVNVGDESSRRALISECAELLAIFTSIGRTAKTRRANSSVAEEDAGLYDPDDALDSPNSQSEQDIVLDSAVGSGTSGPTNSQFEIPNSQFFRRESSS